MPAYDANSLANSNVSMPGTMPGGDGYNPWANGGAPPPGGPGYVPPGGQVVTIDPATGSPFMPNDSGVILVPVPANSNTAKPSPTPIVSLNRAVAVAMADGPQQGLALIDQIVAGGELDDYHLLPATRAELLRRSGLKREAAESYRRALALVTNDAERGFLEKRLIEVESGAPVV